MSFIDDLALQLSLAGVATPGVNMFLGSAAILPTPENFPSGDATSGEGPYIVLTDTGGLAPTRVQNKTSAAYKRPTAQVFVTGTSTALCLVMALEAYSALDGIFNAVVNGTPYLRIAARQEPTDMGVDSTGRNFGTVFNVEAEAASA